MSNLGIELGKLRVRFGVWRVMVRVMVRVMKL